MIDTTSRIKTKPRISEIFVLARDSLDGESPLLCPHSPQRSTSPFKAFNEIWMKQPPLDIFCTTEIAYNFQKHFS